MSPPLPARRRPLMIAVSVAWLAAVAFTNPKFSFLEDEATQVVDATSSLEKIVSSFWFAGGVHEHPPLSDILLHFWLPLAGSSPTLLRLMPAILFLAGLWLLSLAASKLAGDKAFSLAFTIGILCPFFFHFARLAGWYSLCFFLVGWLTLAWLRYLESERLPRLAAFIGVAILLIFSNYYGWAIVSILLFDGFRTRGKRMIPAAALTLAAMAIAWAPVWPAFVSEIRFRTGEGGLLPRLVLGVFNLYTLPLSESIAPWFWWLSVPAGAAMAISLWYAFSLSTRRQRAFLTSALLRPDSPWPAKPTPSASGSSRAGSSSHWPARWPALWPATAIGRLGGN